jgi:uncharacterized protein
VSRVYWDSMLFIYWLEDHPKYARRVGAIRSRMEQRHDRLITGAFTFGEVLTGVFRRGDSQLADEMRGVLRNSVAEVIPFTLETANHYAQIRATPGIAPADAIHLASAAHAGTDLFLTNDKRLIGKIVPGIQFIASLDTDLF